MTANEFNPNSFDAQFATLMAKQDALKDALLLRADGQEATLARIEAQAVKTNGRVNALERWRDTSKAKLAGASLAIGAIGGGLAWIVETWVKP